MSERLMVERRVDVSMEDFEEEYRVLSLKNLLAYVNNLIDRFGIDYLLETDDDPEKERNYRITFKSLETDLEFERRKKREAEFEKRTKESEDRVKKVQYELYLNLKKKFEGENG